MSKNDEVERLLESGENFMESEEYKEALDQFSKALDLNSKNSVVLFKRGICYKRLKEYNEAISNFKNSGDNSPPQNIKIQCFLYLGECYCHLGDDENFKKYFSVLPQNMIFSSQDYYVRGLMYFQNLPSTYRNEKLALSNFSKSIDLDPSNYKAYNGRGNVYCRSQQFLKAYEAWKKSVELEPEKCEPRTYHNLGLLRAKGIGVDIDISKALYYFGKSIERDENMKESYFGRGDLRMKMNLLHESIQDFKSAIEIDPNYLKATKILGQLLVALRFYEDAIPYLTKSIQLLKKSENINEIFNCYHTRGLCYKSLGQFKNALDDLERVKSLNPKNMSFQIAIAECFGHLDEEEKFRKLMSSLEDMNLTSDNLFLRGSMYYRGVPPKYRDLQKSLHDFSKSIEKDPNNCLSYINRGNVHSEMKEYSKSFKDFSKAIEINPKEAIGYYSLGYLYLKGFGVSIDLNEAIYNFTQAINLDQRYKEAYMNRGSAKLDLKMYESAAVDFAAVFELDPKSSKALYNLGHVYFEVNEYKRSIQFYSKAIELNPEYHEAFHSRGNVYFLLSIYQEAEKDFLMAYSLNKSDSGIFAMISLAKLYFEKDQIEKCKRMYQKLIEDHPEIKYYLYYERGRTLKKVDEERALEDFNRMNMLSTKNDLEKVKKNSNLKKTNITEIKKEDIDEIHAQIKRKNFEERKRLKIDSVYKFEKDHQKDIDVETKEIIDLEKKVSSVKFEDIEFHSKLGIGAFGIVYTCRISGKPDLLVLKVFKDGVPEESAERDLLDLPYHRNVVSVLSKKSHLNVIQEIEVKKLPDFKEYWKEEGIELHKTHLIFMKFYRKDLSFYHTQRLYHNMPYSNLELSYVLQNLLKGAFHLHSHFIVHRDMHPGNVFVDELQGRLWIADFGCCLDLRGRGTDECFKVHKNDKILLNPNYSSPVLDKGGVQLAAPEIRNFDEENEEYVNYEKSDLYSIGRVVLELMNSFCVDLSDDNLQKRRNCKLFQIVQNLVKEDPKERIGYGDALKLVEGLIEFYENENLEETEGEN